MSRYLPANELRRLLEGRADAAELLALLNASDPEELIRVNGTAPAAASRQYADSALSAATGRAAEIAVIRYPSATARVLFDDRHRVIAVAVTARG